LRVTIQDFDGDSFNWTITTSPNIGNSNETGANNGTKNCSIVVSLAYSTTYTWYVTAYDGVYWTNKTYWFSTESQGGGYYPGEPPAGTPNVKPVANTSAGEPYHGYVDSEILFDGSKSYDPDGNITKWLWVFGDKTNGTEKTVRHIYSKSGTYTVTLTVTDDDGATNSDTTSCLIKQQNRPPTKPIVTGPTSGTKNTLYTYTAFSTDADNNTIRYTFDWGESVSQSSGFLPNGTRYPVNHSWAAAGRYIVTETVTDNQTESFSNITVYIDAVQTRGVGYLLDYDGDGVYDAFYSEESKQTITTIQKKDGSYFIDSDGDGDWEYRYNATNGFTDYREPRKTPGFEIIVIIGAIALVMFWRRKRRDSD
jgi:PKD repeat protein